MRLISKTFIVTSAATALAFVLAAPQQSAAQTPQPQPTPQPQAQMPAPAPAQAQAQPRSAEGDLVSVDAELKSITVKTATGDEKFMYTEATEISGSQKNAAGLATLKEGRVTVHYTEDAKTKAKTATRIIVQPKQ